MRALDVNDSTYTATISLQDLFSLAVLSLAADVVTTRPIADLIFVKERNESAFTPLYLNERTSQSLQHAVSI